MAARLDRLANSAEIAEESNKRLLVVEVRVGLSGWAWAFLSFHLVKNICHLPLLVSKGLLSPLETCFFVFNVLQGAQANGG